MATPEKSFGKRAAPEPPAAALASTPPQAAALATPPARRFRLQGKVSPAVLTQKRKKPEPELSREEAYAQAVRRASEAVSICQIEYGAHGFAAVFLEKLVDEAAETQPRITKTVVLKKEHLVLPIKLADEAGKLCASLVAAGESAQADGCEIDLANVWRVLMAVMNKLRRWLAKHEKGSGDVKEICGDLIGVLVFGKCQDYWVRLRAIKTTSEWFQFCEFFQVISRGWTRVLACGGKELGFVSGARGNPDHFPRLIAALISWAETTNKALAVFDWLWVKVCPDVPNKARLTIDIDRKPKHLYEIIESGPLSAKASAAPPTPRPRGSAAPPTPRPHARAKRDVNGKVERGRSHVLPEKPTSAPSRAATTSTSAAPATAAAMVAAPTEPPPRAARAAAPSMSEALPAKVAGARQEAPLTATDVVMAQSDATSPLISPPCARARVEFDDDDAPLQERASPNITMESTVAPAAAGIPAAPMPPTTSPATDVVAEDASPATCATVNTTSGGGIPPASAGLPAAAATSTTVPKVVADDELPPMCDSVQAAPEATIAPPTAESPAATEPASTAPATEDALASATSPAAAVSSTMAD